MLKKQPDFDVAKVLMALALLRLGRTQEAQGHLEAVLGRAPVDEAVLNAMSIAYRELQMSEYILIEM